MDYSKNKIMTKEETIEIIKRIPETAQIEIDFSVSEPTGNNHYLSPRSNYMLSTENKHTIEILIEYRK